MKIISKILDMPFIWGLSQFIFGCDRQKMILYRSVFPHTGRMLDFGCAHGNTFPAFADFEYYGLDSNKPLIDHARRKYAKYPNARFVNADILDRPFHPGFFDFILFACTGHHIPDVSLMKIMPALSDSLKKGGSIYYFDTIKVPGKDTALLKFLISLDQGKFMRDAGKYHVMVHEFSPHLKPVVTKTIHVKGNFFPQPTYFYTEFKKI